MVPAVSTVRPSNNRSLQDDKAVTLFTSKEHFLHAH